MAVRTEGETERQEQVAREAAFFRGELPGQQRQAHGREQKGIRAGVVGVAHRHRHERERERDERRKHRGPPQDEQIEGARADEQGDDRRQAKRELRRAEQRHREVARQIVERRMVVHPRQQRFDYGARPVERGDMIGDDLVEPQRGPRRLQQAGPQKRCAEQGDRDMAHRRLLEGDLPSPRKSLSHEISPIGGAVMARAG